MATSLAADESESGPLTFNLPKSATIESREFGKGTIYSYTIVLEPADQPGLLMLSSLPGNTPAEAMKSMAETMRISFESEMRSNTKLKIENLTSETSDFKIGIWEGYQTQFTGNVGETKLFQLMFTLWDGNQVWNGQFTGKESDYQRVVDIFGSAKRTSEQGAAANP